MPALDLNAMIAAAIGKKASDLLIVPGQPTRIRVDGEIQPFDGGTFTPDQTREFAKSVFGEERLSEIPRHGYLDTARYFDGGAIVRISAALSNGAYTIGVRIRSTDAIPSLEKVGLPEAVKKLLTMPNGLILVAGPHGSGKTTTLYSMVDWINHNRAVHLCTVEDPRHYAIKPAKALVQQREVGSDVSSAAAGIAAAMRQDLDVILVGEIADIETLGAAAQAAETGHLVLTQVHADSAADAVTRLLEAAPEDMRPMFQRQLAATIRGITCQRLLKSGDGKHRTAVYELVLADEAFSRQLREKGDVRGCGGGEGSVRMVDSLRALIKRQIADNKMTPEEGEKALRQLGG